MHTALAVGNKIIHLLQVLPERGVHRRSAGKLHVSKIDFLLIQDFGSLREGNLPGGTRNTPGSFSKGIRRQPQFEDSGSHDRSEERRVGKECRSRWSPY